MEIHRTSHGIKLVQEKYSEHVLRTYGMENSKPVSTPMLVNDTNETDSKVRDFSFREAIGSLLYIANKTRSDLSYAVNFSCRRTENALNIDIHIKC